MTRATYASIACELIKTARGQWLTSGELAEQTGLSRDAVQRWLGEFLDQGLMVSRQRDKKACPSGPQPAEFALAREWGGVAS